MAERVHIPKSVAKAVPVSASSSQLGDGCPPRPELRQVGTIKKIVADWRLSFDSKEKSYRQSLYQALAARYALAWAVWEDEEVQKRWIKEDGPLLAGRSSEQNDERFLRSVVVATISDQKHASKVFKRLSAAWIGNVGKDDVFEWLKKHKIEKRPMRPRISLKQFDKVPLVLRGVGSAFKAEANSKIVIEGTITKRAGDEIEVKYVVVRAR